MRSSASSYRSRAVAWSESAARAVARRRGGRGWDPRGGAGLGRRDARADRASVVEPEANDPVRDADAMVVRTVPKRRCAAEIAEGDERARGDAISREGRFQTLRRAPRRPSPEEISWSLRTRGCSEYSSVWWPVRFFSRTRRGVLARSCLNRWRSQFSPELRDRRRPSRRRHTRPAPRRRSPLTTERTFRDSGSPAAVDPRPFVGSPTHGILSRTHATLSVAAVSDLRAHVRHVRRRGGSRGVPRRA